MAGSEQKTHVYGPVPSRRLGLSLGVDLVPYKVCCLDCVYCQLGPTTELTTRRAPFVDPDQVAREVEQALRRGPRPEVITLAGSGEPTLHSGLGQVASALRRVTDLPLCLLTNGALLSHEDVRQAALGFDLVAPSLDAADEATFRRLNRPAPGVTFDGMVQGLREFCAAFGGRCQLEVVLVQGHNTSPASVEALARLSSSLAVASVDLNTVVRPPALVGVAGVPQAELEQILRRFVQLGCPARIIAPWSGKQPGAARTGALCQQILETVSRRPCTARDLSAVLGISTESARAACDEAVDRGDLLREQRVPDGETYYLRRS